MEIFENESRENYSKVVLHKQLWIPLVQDNTRMMDDTPSPNLSAWRARQEAERERIRRLEHTPVPPQRPPKKAHLRQTTKLLKSAEETLGITAGSLAEKRKLFSGSRSSDHPTSQSSLQIKIGDSSGQILVSKNAKKRPPVPPKPVFEKHSGGYQRCKALSETFDQGNSCSRLPECHQKKRAPEDNADEEDNPDNNDNNKENLKRRTLVRSNYWQKQDNDVMKENSDDYDVMEENSDDNDVMEENSDDNIETLEKDRRDIVLEIDTNNAAGEAIVNIINDSGSMSEVDKVKVHIKEVESVTNLVIVLRERMDRIEEELSQVSAKDEREGLLAKKQKLFDQIEEANKLKQFRDKRGKMILDTLSKLLDADSLQKFQSFLEKKVRLIRILREIDYKMNKQLK